MRITHVNSCWIILGVSPGPFPAFPAPFFWEIPQIPPHYSGHWEASPQSCFSQAAQKLARNEMELFQRAAAPPQYNPNNDNHCIALFIYIVIFKKKCTPNRFRNQNLCDIAISVTISEAFRFLGCSMAIRFRGVLRCCDLPLLWAAPIGIQLGDPYPRFPFMGAIGAMGIPIPMRPSCLPIGSFQAAPTPAPGGGAASA